MTFSLKKTIAAVLIAGIEFVKNLLLKQIPSDWTEVRTPIALEFERIKQLINIFADDNPRNLDQVKALLHDILQQDTVEIVKAAIAQGLAKIKDEKARKLAQALSFPIIGTVVALTDDDPDNEAQIKKAFADFLQNPETGELAYNNIIEPFFRAKIKDEATLNFLLGFLRNILLQHS